MRYLCGGGFALLYAYVMFTSSTDLTFCYVIVMLLILLVYADKKLVSLLCTYALVINILVLDLSCRYTWFHRCPDYQCRDYNRLHYPFLYFCIDVCHKDCADQRCQHQKGGLRTAPSPMIFLKLTLKVAGDMAGNIDQVSSQHLTAS